jgi:hypothetical protein
MELIHDRLLNNQFAPGIATYGIDGKDGASGPAGTSIYFTSYSLDDREQQNNALIKIRNNKVLSEFTDLELGRQYAIGDLILDSMGRIYKLVKTTGEFTFEYVTKVVGVGENEYFSTSDNNRLFLSSSYKTKDYNGSEIDNTINGLDIIQGTDNNKFDGGTTDFTMRVINTKKDDKTGKFNILQLMAKPVSSEEKTLSITFDEADNAFVIDSSCNIFIDTDSLEVKNVKSDYNSLGEYYRVTPYNDPIGIVHKILSGASYKLERVNTGETEETEEGISIPIYRWNLIISGIDMNPIKTLGFDNKFIVKYDSRSDYIFVDNLSPEEDGTITISNIVAEPTRVSVIKGIEIFLPKNQN